MKEKCIFGPVQSRRLGMSLGINLTPYKTCSLDCAYCECGKTTDLTIIRKDYILIEQVQKTLKDIREVHCFDRNLQAVSLSPDLVSQPFILDLDQSLNLQKNLS